MFFSVYVLKSLQRNYFYVGLTNNIDRRVRQHQEGKERTTRPYLPFQLLVAEEYETRADARIREKYFKSGIGKERLKEHFGNMCPSGGIGRRARLKIV